MGWLFFLFQGALQPGTLWAGPRAEYEHAASHLQNFVSQLPYSEKILIQRTDFKKAATLPPSQRALIEKFHRLKTERAFWQQAMDLQQALLDLPNTSKTRAEEEAGQIATRALETAQTLTQQYHVTRPAVFHNMLINIGLKKRGLCYHWASDLLTALQKLPLKTYQLHWGVAHRGQLSEHNSVVVTSPGSLFDEGLVLDAWRHSGQLYWARVKKDHYPWKELPPEEL